MFGLGLCVHRACYLISFRTSIARRASLDVDERSEKRAGLSSLFFFFFLILLFLALSINPNPKWVYDQIAISIYSHNLKTHETTHKTQHIKNELHHPATQELCPISMGRTNVSPPADLGATAPHGHGQSARHRHSRVCDHPRRSRSTPWFLVWGVPKLPLMIDGNTSQELLHIVMTSYILGRGDRRESCCVHIGKWYPGDSS